MAALKILDVTIEPIETISFLTISQNATELSEHVLPIFTGTITGLPDEVSAIIIASDLQGIIPVNNKDLLLGEVLVNHLDLIFDIHFPSVDKKNVVVFLCGDLYANKLKRGASGNPISVWQKFSTTFGWTVGIAGNHDDFGSSLNHLLEIKNTKFLLNTTMQLKGLRISGLSGIIGRPDKNFRLPEADYFKALSKLLNKKPDILLMHLSPHIAEREFQGEKALTELLVKGNKALVFSGHSHWHTTQPYLLENGTQVLNADTKVFILTKAEAPL